MTDTLPGLSEIFPWLLPPGPRGPRHSPLCLVCPHAAHGWRHRGAILPDDPLSARPVPPGSFLGPTQARDGPSEGTKAQGLEWHSEVTQPAGGFSLGCGSTLLLQAPLLPCPLDPGHLLGHRGSTGGRPAKLQAPTLLTQPPRLLGAADGTPGCR